MALILANVRTPDEREGDLTAQIAANRVGEARLREIVAKYGLKRVERYATALQDYTERMLRATIAAFPTASTGSRIALDGDGFAVGPAHDPGRRRASRAIRQRSISPAAIRRPTGGVNANFAITLSATLYAFRCLVEDDVLYNAGIARARARWSRPRARSSTRSRPAAVAGGNVETSQRITDVVLGALAQALPDRHPGRQPGHDEQCDARRRGPAYRPARSRTTKRSAAGWAAARTRRASAACTRT